MESLSQLGIQWSLLIAQTVNFVILFGVLSYFAYRPMLKFLDERSAKIEQGLRDAELAKKRLEEVAQEESAILGNAHKEAKDLLIKADTVAKERSAGILLDAQKSADRFLEDAKKQSAEMTKQMVSDAQKELAGVVVIAVEKIIREKISSGSDEVFLQKTLKDIQL